MRQFSIGLYHRYVLYTGSETSTTTFPVPSTIYSDASCGFYIPLLVNNQGEQFLTPQRPTRRILRCDYDAFKQQRQNLERSLNTLANFNGSTAGATVAAVIEVRLRNCVTWPEISPQLSKGFLPRDDR